MKPADVLPLHSWLSPARRPEQPVARDGTQSICLGQLQQEVRTLATFVQQQQAQRWAICTEDSHHFLVALLALLHSGKSVIIPGNTLNGPLNDLKQHYDAALSDLSPVLDRPVHDLPTLLATPGAGDLMPVPEEATLSLFTSGSTGSPQQVVRRVSSMDREAALLAPLFSRDMTPDEVLGTVTHQHLYGLTFRLWLPLSLGIPFHARMQPYQEELGAALSDRALLITSPAFIKRVDTTLAPLRCAAMVSAGGMLPWADAQRLQRWTGRLITEIYGSTETGVLAWRRRQDEHQGWTPLDGVRFESAGDALSYRAFSPLIESPQGQLLSDELEFGPDGSFRIKGRRGRVVKIEEKRIALDDVEQRLQALPQIEEAAVIVLEKPRRVRLGAVVVLSRAGRAEQAALSIGRFTAALRQALHGSLEPVAIPRNWRFVDELPLNSVGKLSRSDLEALFDAAARQD